MNKRFDSGLGNELIQEVHDLMQQGTKKISDYHTAQVAGKREKRIGGTQFGGCLRKIHYELTQGRQNRTISSPNFLNDGHVHEDAMFNQLINGLGTDVPVERNVEVEQEISDGVYLVGHPDGILHLSPERKVVVECKAVKPPKFREVEKTGIEETWNKQVQCYMYLTGIKDAILLMKNRETSKIVIFHIEYDEKYVLEEIDRLQRLIKSPSVPDPEPQNSKCEYCPFYEQCQGE